MIDIQGSEIGDQTKHTVIVAFVFGKIWKVLAGVSLFITKQKARRRHLGEW